MMKKRDLKEFKDLLLSDVRDVITGRKLLTFFGRTYRELISKEIREIFKYRDLLFDGLVKKSEIPLKYLKLLNLYLDQDKDLKIIVDKKNKGKIRYSDISNRVFCMCSIKVSYLSERIFNWNEYFINYNNFKKMIYGDNIDNNNNTYITVQGQQVEKLYSMCYAVRLSNGWNPYVLKSLQGTIWELLDKHRDVKVVENIVDNLECFKFIGNHTKMIKVLRTYNRWLLYSNCSPSKKYGYKYVTRKTEEMRKIKNVCETVKEKIKNAIEKINIKE